MDGALNQSQIDYVLFHLGLHCTLTNQITNCFHFSIKNKEGNHHRKIIFPLSSERLQLEKVIYNQDLPILFPVAENPQFFSVDEEHNVIFQHDLLKSIFYLLSGYQEYANPNSRDALGRFAFTDSVQSKLNITEKPLVNYYFEQIVKGIEVFCQGNKIHFKKRRPFETFGLLLTHDVDYLDKYTFNYFVYKVKELTGLRSSRVSRWTNLQLLLKGLLHFSKIKKGNPFWNFTWLRTTEKKHAWRSVFYFLDKGIRHSDASYSFEEKRVRMLFEELQRDGCEIGLHGRVRSIANKTNMEESLLKLSDASHATVKGIRQHRLLWKHPQTALIQEEIGFTYDTTLGFAAHEGFRNSYCYPFRLFDFEKNSMTALWELPLTVMDGTLFAYQNYTPEQALRACEKIIQEVQYFGGLFTLLWHNNFFEEEVYPGITDFYLTLLDVLATHKPINMTGIELAEYIDQFHTKS